MNRTAPGEVENGPNAEPEERDPAPLAGGGRGRGRPATGPASGRSYQPKVTVTPARWANDSYSPAMTPSSPDTAVIESNHSAM